MKIDVFNHFYPRRFFDEYINVGASFKDMGKRVQNLPTIVDLDARFRAMDEFGDFCQVLTLPQPPVESLAGPEKTPLMARIVNDGLAELVARHPKRFIAYGACLPMNNPDEALKELDRASSTLGAKGAQIYTNINEQPLDKPEFQPVFDEIARRGLTVWLHPTRGANHPDYLTEDKSLYEIWWTFGWPYETSVAMSRLVFSGLFDRHPDIKIISHHGGAMIPFFEGRVGYGWDQLGKRTSDVDYTVLLKSMKKRPIDYFRNFLADTALFGARSGTQCALDFFGIDRMLFASDMPFEPTPGLYVRETIRVIESLDLSADEKDRIYRRNAERLLNL
ncbi:MAG TPA: amidohydrolase family protein [Vicinamibacterales bacterium]|nr:amidohydrolase family protein [Vicinamibacterales bacterium]